MRCWHFLQISVSFQWKPCFEAGCVLVSGVSCTWLWGGPCVLHPQHLPDSACRHLQQPGAGLLVLSLSLSPPPPHSPTSLSLSVLSMCMSFWCGSGCENECFVFPVRRHICWEWEHVPHCWSPQGLGSEGFSSVSHSVRFTLSLIAIRMGWGGIARWVLKT